jgi:hypothetical protein
MKKMETLVIYSGKCPICGSTLMQHLGDADSLGLGTLHCLDCDYSVKTEDFEKLWNDFNPITDSVEKLIEDLKAIQVKDEKHVKFK